MLRNLQLVAARALIEGISSDELVAVMSLDGSIVELSATIFAGPSIASERARSSCIFCWITTANCPRSR
jgi:hypothetical protein